MALLPIRKNNDERPMASVASPLPAYRGTQTEFGSLKRFAKSRTLMLSLLTVAFLISGSVAILMRPSHAADTASASSAAGTNVSSTTGELAIKPKAPNPSKVNKPIESKSNWEDLTAAQKQILAPLASGWNELKLSTRKKWIEISKRFARMSSTEQTRVQERMHDWVNLTPEQRRLVRENYARNRQLDTEQRAKRWAEYQQLPEAEKQKLAAEAAAANNRKRVTSQVLSPPAKPQPTKPIQLAPKLAPAPALTLPPAAAPAVDAVGH